MNTIQNIDIYNSQVNQVCLGQLVLPSSNSHLHVSVIVKVLNLFLCLRPTLRTEIITDLFLLECTQCWSNSFYTAISIKFQTYDCTYKIKPHTIQIGELNPLCKFSCWFSNLNKKPNLYLHWFIGKGNENLLKNNFF